jgi:hypothetical protein
MKKENESDGFLGFMNFVYYAFIAIIFIGTIIGIKSLPENSGSSLKLIFLFVGLIQILILVNLIVLNKRTTDLTIDGEDENPNITDGLFEKFYDNGNIKIRGNYVNGKKDGVWESFYYDGSPNGNQTFKNGQEIL